MAGYSPYGWAGVWLNYEPENTVHPGSGWERGVFRGSTPQGEPGTCLPCHGPSLQENLATACDCIQRLRADMGNTNLLSPLKWIVRQPVHQGHPRILFLITEGAVSNTGKVLELVRIHASSTRSAQPEGRESHYPRLPRLGESKPE